MELSLICKQEAQRHSWRSKTGLLGDVLVCKQEFLLDCSKVNPLRGIEQEDLQFSNSVRASFCLALRDARESLGLIVSNDSRRMPVAVPTRADIEQVWKSHDHLYPRPVFASRPSSFNMPSLEHSQRICSPSK